MATSFRAPLRVCACMRMCVCMHVRVCAHASVCVCVRAYTRECACMKEPSFLLPPRPTRALLHSVGWSSNSRRTQGDAGAKVCWLFISLTHHIMYCLLCVCMLWMHVCVYWTLRFHRTTIKWLNGDMYCKLFKKTLRVGTVSVSMCLRQCVCQTFLRGGWRGLFELLEIASPVVGRSNCIHGVPYYIHE